MNIFRVFLVLLFGATFWYTAVVGINHGWDILPLFFGDIAIMNWAGQFNLDFMCHLMLSGLWIAWRNHYSTLGILLGILALVGGILLLTVYLLIVSYQANGDTRVILLGSQRVQSKI
jgi:hypothetical protein